MTGTSTAGADWKGGGEIKETRRRVGRSVEEDEPAPIGHNRAPQAAAHQASGAEIALEEQALICDGVLEAIGAMERFGRELLELRARFLAVQLERLPRIMLLRAAGLTLEQIGKQVGLTAAGVLYQIRRAASGGEARPGKGLEASFLDYAHARFNRPRDTLRACMRFAKVPGSLKIRNQISNKNSTRARRLGALVLASQAGKVAPRVFKKAILALGERDSPARVGTLCWYILLEVGSDDPQEVARWFAANRLV
jgi:hypothetical protein